GLIVFGSQPHCQAARMADMNTDLSFWVLTDRRFAFVTAEPLAARPTSKLAKAGRFAKELGQVVTGADERLPVEEVRLTTVWALTPGQYSFLEPLRRKRESYDRIGFADGS